MPACGERNQVRELHVMATANFPFANRAGPTPRAGTRDRRLPAAAAPTPPASAPASAEQPHDEQQHHGSDRCIDDRSDDTGAEMDAEARQQPIADERADDADQEIADEAKAGPLDDLTRQPAGDETDEQDDEQT